MKLMNNKGRELVAGDIVKSFRGELYRFDFAREPHKAGSTGRVYVTPCEGGRQREFFPSVIGAAWIEGA